MICAVLRNRSTIALLTAELISTTGIQMTFVALPWEAVGLVLFACGVFVPLVNAPIMGLLSTRPPEALRAKVMTAVMTASALGGPAGRLVIGPMFANWGINTAYAVLAGTISLGALLFVLATLRAGDVPATAPVRDLAI